VRYKVFQLKGGVGVGNNRNPEVEDFKTDSTALTSLRTVCIRQFNTAGWQFCRSFCFKNQHPPFIFPIKKLLPQHNSHYFHPSTKQLPTIPICHSTVTHHSHIQPITSRSTSLPLMTQSRSLNQTFLFRSHCFCKML